MYKVNLHIIIFCILTIPSCIEPFEISSSEPTGTLVVEGQLSNITGNNYVTLKYTNPLSSEEDSTSTYEVGADVMVINQDGTEITFTEELDGRYMAPVDFTGTIGHSYMLSFTTSDGKQYQTDFQQLPAPANIDSVYQRLVELPDGPSGDFSQGIQFFVDSHNEMDDGRFYRFEYEETYQLRVPTPSYYEVKNGQLTGRNELNAVCYVTNLSNKGKLESTAGLAENRLSAVPVQFHAESDPILREGYSLLVRQLSISPDAFGYYKRLFINNESSGSLVDQQNGPVIGNVSSLDNPSELVLGFFEVSASTEKRAFFSPEMYGPEFDKGNYEFACDPASDGILIRLEDAVAFAQGNNSFQIHVLFPDNFPEWALFMGIDCTKCDDKGSTEKPAFWKE